MHTSAALSNLYLAYRHEFSQLTQQKNIQSTYWSAQAAWCISVNTTRLIFNLLFSRDHLTNQWFCLFQGALGGYAMTSFFPSILMFYFQIDTVAYYLYYIIIQKEKKQFRFTLIKIKCSVTYCGRVVKDQSHALCVVYPSPDFWYLVIKSALIVPHWIFLCCSGRWDI